MQSMDTHGMDKNEVNAAFAVKFKTEALFLVQVGTWNVAVRPGQLTLGSMVVSVRSGAFQFGDLSATEHSDMGAAFALAERLAITEFGATRINLLCLMMQDPIVHFHVLPRYSSSQDRYGKTWVDQDWPGPPVVGTCDTPDDVLQQIRTDLLMAI